MKKSIGSKRAVVYLCAVLIAVSAFFYAPMEVSAEEIVSTDTGSIQCPTSGINSYKFDRWADDSLSLLGFDDNLYYSLNFHLYGDFEFNHAVWFTNFFIRLDNTDLKYIPWDTGGAGEKTFFYFDEEFTVIMKGSDINGATKRLNYNAEVANGGAPITDLTCDFNLSLEVVSYSIIATTDAESYQNGYNAGYAEGETDGYSNGYSQGYLEGEENGFLAGQDSVDTDTYYDVGYNVGYSSGYASGYDEGYSSALKSVQSSDGAWGQYKFLGTMQKVKRAGVPFYVSSNGLIDMEEYQSGANGYFYNTQPGTYDGYSTISYHIPFYDFSNGYTQIDSNKFNVKFEVLGINPYLTSDLGGGDSVANIMRSRVEEVYVVYNGKKYYGNYDIGTSYVQFDFFVENVANPTLLGDASMTLYFVLHNTVTLVTDSHESIYISGQYLPNLEFELGRDTAGYAVAIRPYISNDRVSANIKDQTEQITGSLEEQKEIEQGQLEEQKEQTETQKGIAASIKDFFGSFFDNLINSIIHVIVPTKEEMGELFNRLNDFFAETFGFLYYPFDFIIEAFNIFLEADSETGLTFPGFSIMGHEVWPDMTYDLTSEPIVNTIFGYVRMGTGAMLAMWFVNYLRSFFDKRFGGGGS